MSQQTTPDSDVPSPRPDQQSRCAEPTAQAQSQAPAQSSNQSSDQSPEPEVSQSRPRPTQEEIAVRAYEYYLARGQEPGYDQEDWYKAEQDLLSTWDLSF